MIEMMNRTTELRVGTHDGEFHADEVLAIASLKIAASKSEGLIIPEIEVVRTRDPEVLETCDVLVDVGSEYDPARNLFDHHQEGGAGERSNKIPYASLGLIWKEVGPTVCDGSQDCADFVDGHLIQLIDAYDNHFPLFEKGDIPHVGDLLPGVSITNNNFLPGMTEEEKFNEALRDGRKLILGHASRAVAMHEGTPEIREALENAPQPEIVLLPTIEGVRWQATLPDISEEALLVVQPDSGGTRWAVRTVPKDPNSTDMRILLPKAWRGIENSEEIKRVTEGIDNVTFIHPKGFFAATTTQDSAMELADRTVELAQAA